MADTREHDDAKPMQKTQPRGVDKDGKPFDPVEIPVPTRDAVLRDLARAALPLRAEKA